MPWIAPDAERSEDYPPRRNEPEREVLRDWLDWHRATLLRNCAGLDATQLASRSVPPSRLSLLAVDVRIRRVLATGALTLVNVRRRSRTLSRPR